MSKPLRRTVCSWDSAPRDGTPFHILNTLRFNQFADRFEALCHADEGVRWQPITFGEHEPSMWLRLVPLPYDIPTSFAFTVAFEVRPKSWRERLMARFWTSLFHCWSVSAARPLLHAASVVRPQATGSLSASFDARRR